MSKRTALVLFLVSAALALAVHYVMFEMTYLWYVQIEQAHLLRGIYAGVAAAIIALWVLFPSRIAVGAVGLFGLYFPHLIFASDARPLQGREITLSGFGVTLVSIALLVIATQFRLMWKRRSGTAAPRA
ncbi:hypothetical protein [Pseudoxanthomonas sp. X-1]|uniref:hypothetical protein n=1 Tax=Pseudoxanthomonas sp. X-1 TaxID=2571115 RepID=UPI00110BDBC6|nr:hypothetical protein [Pseudoxanthomonas sp. X-1]TMN24194.1 hypothetical protein FF950_06655 [Pseudoxanthomonas sp. X-1]UAY75158.1 hypothetical protein LAJ50_02515 [Pseudoxanthomonas sp. X-1]